MKKELTLDVAAKIADEARKTISNSIKNYGDFGKPMTLQQLRNYSNGEHAWIAELMKALIESKPVTRGFTISEYGNYETDVSIEASQGITDMGLEFKLYGKDDQQTKNIAASFIGGTITTKDGQAIEVNKTDIGISEKAAEAANKLADYFAKKYIAEHGEEQ